MPSWTKTAVGDFPLYQAKALAWLPGIVQGFTTRRGGVSLPPYDTLNLGAHVGDDPEAIRTNRQRVWEDLGFREAQIALAEQVHGSEIAEIVSGSVAPVPGADALITNAPDILLMLFYADCVPIYIVDPVRRAIGLVHAGWRGAAANIAGKTVASLREAYGCRSSSLLAAIGPCIGGESYEVGAEVAAHFRTTVSAGAVTAILPRSEFSGTYTLNLRQIIFSQLLASGLSAEYIAVSDQDTFRNRRDFFSYRRDGARTGRMAALLALRP